jgi:hypothetical protein
LEHIIMELFQANKQWSSRPADERFESLEALHAAAQAHRATAHERPNIPLSTLRVENVNGDVQLVGKGGLGAKLTHWAFGQLAARVSAPASYLRDLPATLAAQNLNHGLATRLKDSGSAALNLLFNVAGTKENLDLTLLALTTEKYQRIWNDEITERLLDLKHQGWEEARPDIRVQDSRLPLYLSDHDMFAFIRAKDRIVREANNPEGLHRGVIVGNSQVGASTLFVLQFLYREMCGNHIIWGATNVTELKLRHVGSIRERLQLWDAQIQRYLDSSTSDEEAKIESAQRKRIAGTKEDVLDAIFGKKLGLSRKAIEAGYDAVNPEQDGDPRTVWGIVQGLTRHSQTVQFADERTTIDRAAGKLLEAF